MTDFKEKAKLFDTFFVKQHSLIKNNSLLPTDLISLTENRLFNLKLTPGDISRIIQNPESNKAHGHHKNSILMLKSQLSNLCLLFFIIVNWLISFRMEKG